METAVLFFLCFKTDFLVRVANMYMVGDRDAHILIDVHKCGCGVWERGSDLVCCVSQVYSLSLLRINEVQLPRT